MGISGLDLEAYPQRIYPQGDLFANVVGFLNDERVAQAGLEQVVTMSCCVTNRPAVFAGERMAPLFQMTWRQACSLVMTCAFS